VGISPPPERQSEGPCLAVGRRPPSRHAPPGSSWPQWPCPHASTSPGIAILSGLRVAGIITVYGFVLPGVFLVSGLLTVISGSAWCRPRGRCSCSRIHSSRRRGQSSTISAFTRGLSPSAGARPCLDCRSLLSGRGPNPKPEPVWVWRYNAVLMRRGTGLAAPSVPVGSRGLRTVGTSSFRISVAARARRSGAVTREALRPRARSHYQTDGNPYILGWAPCSLTLCRGTKRQKRYQRMKPR
jgi:hypothetical protein